MFNLRVVIIICMVFPSLVLGQESVPQKPKVSKSVYFGISPAIRDIPVIIPGQNRDKSIHKSIPNDATLWDVDTNSDQNAKVLGEFQKEMGHRKARNPVVNFEGMDNVGGWVPADPNGDVGLNYYVQTINTSFAVFDKSGNLVYGPVDNKTIWDNFPGPWNDVYWGGDPVFKYDQMADRWLMTTFSLNDDDLLYYEMVAVSVTSDPLGEYYCYAFQFDMLNDYPKVGIWNNGYYITYNMFEVGWGFYNMKVTALDRDAMLAGEEEATMIEFDIWDAGGAWTVMPADLRGFNIPEDAPNYLIYPYHEEGRDPIDITLRLYEFIPDWDVPLTSYFALSQEFNVGPIDSNYPNGAEQPGSIQNVEALPYRMMYPMTYRKFDDHESMVACHTLWNEGVHFIRWYEFRKYDDDWEVYQMGNYEPDTAHRYEGSISINAKGDIGLGFTISDENINPSVRVTGRREGDPVGEMTFQELHVFDGAYPANNVASGRNRWGDYSSMNVDPANDSTFWFTTMYTNNQSGWGNWSTRITAFDLTDDIPEPSVWAGNDTAICLVPIFTTQGEAMNYSLVYWSTSGDGHFSYNYTLNAKYFRGNGDLANGQVTLTLHVVPYLPGEVVTDSMILHINKNPVAYAGQDDLICIGDSYTMQGEVEFSDDYYWTTTGDGTFNDSTLLNAIYTPGPGDVSNGSVILILNAEPMEACTLSDMDDMVLTIDDCTGLLEMNQQGFSLSISPNPSKSIFNISFSHIENQELQLEVLNIAGQALFTAKLNPTGTSLVKQVDLSFLDNGMYFVRVVQGINVRTVKIIKK